MRRSHVLCSAAAVVLLLLVTSPLFFDIYRAAAFNTAPRDDYAPYLLYLIGRGGTLPGAPMDYRPLSVVAAIPFYFLLPQYRFTNLANPDLSYLRATEALSAVAYLSLVSTSVLMYVTCRRRLGASIKASLAVALLVFFLSAFISREGVDPLAILMITALLYIVDRPLLFSLLVLPSAWVNEKVVIVLAIILVLRYADQRRRSLLPQLLASWIAFAAYLMARTILHAPGWENQMSPSTYLSSVVSMLPYIFSFKGAITNLIPAALIAFLASVSAWTVHRPDARTPFAWRSDALVWPVMFLIGMAIEMQWTVGRLVMFTYPLYLPVLARWIDRRFPERVADDVAAPA